ncbi:hypothetical protein DID75_02490 [Candidatus Marinamargulisbacteria bacterium SCGC AG-410-N11]|nr:hypothetical protein DID75_02490 [Candidatus Marinamargulisbacteria bacterium SCGC AG-410-N11]
MNKKRIITNLIASVIIITLLMVTGCGKLLNKVEKEPDKKETVQTVATTSQPVAANNSPGATATGGSSSSNVASNANSGVILDNMGGIWIPAEKLRKKSLTNVNKIHFRCKGTPNDSITLQVIDNGKVVHILTANLGAEGIVARDIELESWVSNVIVVSKGKQSNAVVVGNNLTVSI